MKLLILLIAMGVIGIIGTVEYSHAQTPLTITANNIPDDEYGSFEIWSDGKGGYYLGTSNDTFTYSDNDEPQSNFHFQRNINLETNPIFPTKPNDFVLCSGEIANLKDIDNTFIQNLTIPDNITPNTKPDVTAIGINIYVNETQFAINGDEYTTPCQTNLESYSTYPIFTDKELRITIIGKHDKKSYYFSPRENVLQAQPIPLCINDNFHTSNQTLKGNTKMCYGKNGNDMIIITKRFLGFYGATESITAPTKPIALDSNIAETKESYDEKLRLKALAEQQEREYLALLKKLYLPAI